MVWRGQKNRRAYTYTTSQRSFLTARMESCVRAVDHAPEITETRLAWADRHAPVLSPLV
jgi:hypothetical protein